MKNDAVKFALSEAQVNWVKLMNLPLEESFNRYKKAGGSVTKYVYKHFLETPQGNRYSGIAVEDAKKVIRSLGLTIEMFEAISLISKDIDDSASINDLTSLLEACTDFLWNGTGRKSPTKQKSETLVVDLVRGVLNRDQTLMRETRKVALGELFDYLLENRMFKEYKDCLWGLARKTREDLCNIGRPWFPGCSAFDKDGYPIMDLVRTNAMSEGQFEEAAILVRCVNMQINAVRSSRFQDKLRYDNLSLYSTSSHQDPTDAKSYSDDVEALNREKDAAKIKGLQKKIWLRKAFGEVNQIIKPVWMFVYEKSDNPHRWTFLSTGARLFYDWARYNWYSLDKTDVKLAANMYEQIYDMALKCVDDCHVDAKIKADFLYMASTACRYMAEATSAKKWRGSKTSVGYVVESINCARSAIKYIPKHSRAYEYRFGRNLARIQTFAVRWWLKHKMPDMYGDVTFDGQTNLRGQDPRLWGINVLKEALSKIETTLRVPISPDDRVVGGGPLCLKGKRLLEWEFHLRVQIEAIIAWLPFDPDAAHVEENNTRRDLARAALACILLNYGHLCNGVTHLSQKSLDWAVKQSTMAEGNHDFYFDSVKTLRLTSQENPPSVPCRLEILNSILSFTNDRNRQKTRLCKTLENLESDGSPARCALAELEQDLKEIKSLLQNENLEFILKNRREDVCDDVEWFEKEEWKNLPAFSHLDELIWGPGSNSKECERLFSSCNLDWDYYGKGECHA